MKIFFFTFLSVAAFFHLGVASDSCCGTAKPNVVFILADDIGLGDVAFYHRQRTGGPEVVPTPNLDRLIDSGMRFDRSHSTTSLCSPTRYCAMSGNYTHRSYDEWGVWGSFNTSPFEDGWSVGKLMQEAGYTTGFIGKWHLGGDFNRKGSDEVYTQDVYGLDGQFDPTHLAGGTPHYLGFDYSFCLPAGMQNVPYIAYENTEWYPFAEDSVIKHMTWRDVPKGTDLGKKEGLGDSNWDASRLGPMLANKAVDFIESNAGNDPFFLCYFAQAVHHPHNPPETFNGIKVKGTMGDGKAHHLDMIYEFDLQVGAIVQALKDAGVYENTLLIVTSDNGGMTHHVPGTMETGHDPTHGFRGDKGTIWEGGHRVPFIAVWPGQIEAGAQSDQIPMTHDLAATLYDLTDQPMTTDHALDSINLLPTFLAQPDAPVREEYVVTGQGGEFHIAYYQGPWKLVMRGNGYFPKGSKVMSRTDWLARSKVARPTDFEPLALFNLEENPKELAEGNLVGDANQAERLAQLLDDYRKHRNAKYTSSLGLRND
jgi:arylsulfatase A-like enzyme